MNLNRHSFIGRCTMVLCLACIYSGPIFGADLYVFKPTTEKANVVQAMMEGECEGVSITVFGRVKDFVKKVAEEEPSGIISLGPVLALHSDFSVVAQGHLKGGSDANYSFVSVDAAFDPSSLETSKLGVIDILGRKEMKVYMEDLFGGKVATKRVTKIEDLIPLLNFSAVSALFIEESVLDGIKDSTELNLVETKAKHKVGLVSLAISDPAQSDVLKKCVNKLSPKVNKVLGVEGWK